MLNQTWPLPEAGSSQLEGDLTFQRWAFRVKGYLGTRRLRDSFSPFLSFLCSPLYPMYAQEHFLPSVMVFLTLFICLLSFYPARSWGSSKMESFQSSSHHFSGIMNNAQYKRDGQQMFIDWMIDYCMNEYFKGLEEERKPGWWHGE